MRIVFDHGSEGGAVRFEQPLRLVTAWDPDEAAAAFAALDAARAEGFWLAGYASYELGYALEPRLAPLMPEDRDLPLLQFGVYAAPEAATLESGPAEMGAHAPRWDADRYALAFQQVHDLIGAGDIYQANLTFPIDAQTVGSAAALYKALTDRQPVGFGALIEQPGLPAILSRSPELFFRTDARGVIETRPMKGTQPRSTDRGKDARLRAFLATDEKNLAENLMIVDLLRNDISRVALAGSVHVPELFQIESYETLHQMVSLIRARLKPGSGLGDIFAALFPCGSITGAPKIRAMEIIRALEPWPRGIYCGAIGWAAPDGRSLFNVAIRTITLGNDGAAVLNVGGGVVWDSTAKAEYEEALWKARYAAPFRRG